ncbi:MAG: glycosyltransferase family 8 protein [Chitinispirillia bacterium]|nr:glycosyltransferase family 8 protein [Chitinispirillia bacterium]MCL2268365.1 glycosyltransferase family 8 protein [Chitinispirillia bacterium]MCL2269612.1 glycosyltransferase family 8 protein [Chitinispirillia bacterium]
MDPNQKFNVAFATNDSFAMQTGISMLSLLKNNAGLDTRVYILASKISGENRARLEEIARNRAELHIIDITEFLSEKAKSSGIASYASSFDAYSRIWITDLLPGDMRQILYLDGDTVVNGSLKELAETDLGDGCACAMIKDVRTEKFKKKIGLENVYEYHNSGIILINLDYWRKHNTGGALIRDIIDFPTIYPDQNALNRVLRGKIKTLPLKFNAVPGVRLYGNKSICSIAYRSGAQFYPDSALNEARDNPAILHHTNYYLSGRPWFSDCFDREGLRIWRTYLAESPWAAGFKPKNQHKPAKSACMKLLRALYTVLPEKLFILLIVKMFEKVARPIFGIGSPLRR